MLNEFQQESVWDGWLAAEIRSAYFAELARKYQQTQKWMTAGMLVLSSGATFALISTGLPEQWRWLRFALTLLTALLSAWSLVAKNERNSIDCADLHFRWSMLAVDYEALWSNVYNELASDKLMELRKREAEVSKSSTTMPDNERLMLKCQENVELHHQHQLAA